MTPQREPDSQHPHTEAYLERMARRDDPDDQSVCEHNVERYVEVCPDCRTPRSPR